MNTKNLKWLLPRLPLPMLALAASYGVYQFALLFVPWWVALIQAAAFEVTYIGLAMVESETPDQRRRATAISIGAVVVSVLYNSLAGFLHRNGLGELATWGEVVLATLHGAPLAIVAYLVADLLLHKSLPEVTTGTALVVEEPLQEPDIAFTKVAADVTLDDLLSSMGKTREEALALLHRYGLMDTAPKYAYQALKRYSTLPDDLTEERFAVLLVELKASAPVPTSPKPTAKIIPATRPTLLEELVGDVEEEVLAPAKDTSLSIKERVVAALESNPLLEDAELYALLPDKKPGSVRVYSSAWRKENVDRIAAAKSLAVANGNGRY